MHFEATRASQGGCAQKRCNYRFVEGCDQCQSGWNRLFAKPQARSAAAGIYGMRDPVEKCAVHGRAPIA